MKRMLPLAVLVGCAALIGSCSSFRYLMSDNYVQAGIRMTTDPAAVSDMQRTNQWTSEFGFTYSAKDVGVMIANRLAAEGRHDVLILIELSSPCIPPYRNGMESQNMWRISVYPVHPENPAK